MAMKQRVNISGEVDFAAHRLRDIVRRVTWLPRATEASVLRLMAYRYETLWLPLQSCHEDSTLVPPVDIHFMWLVHMLAPTHYEADCKKRFGKLLDHTFAKDQEAERVGLKNTLQEWRAMYGDEDFFIKLEDDTVVESVLQKSTLGIDLVDQAQTLLQFYFQISFPHFGSPSVRAAACMRYRKFLGLQKGNPDRDLIPDPDIALIWLGHMVLPSSYAKDIRGSFDRLIHYDFSIPSSWRQPETARLHALTADLWKIENTQEYRENGMTYRGPPLTECVQETPEELVATAAYRYQVTINTAELVTNESFNHGSFSVIFTKADRTLRVRPFWRAMKLDGPPGTWLSRKGEPVARFTYESHMFHHLHVAVYAYKGPWFLAAKRLVAHRLHPFLCEPRKSQDTGTKVWEITLKSPDSSEYLDHVKLRLYGEVTSERCLGHYMKLREEEALRPVDNTRDLWGEGIMWPLGVSFQGSTALRADFAVMNHQQLDVYNIRVLHCAEPRMSAVICRDAHEDIVCTAHLLDNTYLPTPQQVSDRRKCVTLDPNRGERAFLLKDSQGDWGVAVGRWVVYRWGRLRTKILRHNPGFLNVKLHCFRDQTTYVTNTPYRLHHKKCFDFNYRLDRVEAGLEHRDIRIYHSPYSPALWTAMAFVVPMLWTLVHPRPQKDEEGNEPELEPDEVDTTEDDMFLPRISIIRDRDMHYYRATTKPKPRIIKASSLLMPRLVGFIYPEADLIPTNDYIRSVDGTSALGGFYTNQYLHWDDDNSDGDFGGRIHRTDSVGEISYSLADTDEVFVDSVDDKDEEGVDNPNFDMNAEKSKLRSRYSLGGEMSSTFVTGTSVMDD